MSFPSLILILISSIACVWFAWLGTRNIWTALTAGLAIFWGMVLIPVVIVAMLAGSGEDRSDPAQIQMWQFAGVGLLWLWLLVTAVRGKVRR